MHEIQTQSFMSQMYLGQSNTDKAQTYKTHTDLRLQTRRAFELLRLQVNQQGEEGGLGTGDTTQTLVLN